MKADFWHEKWESKSIGFHQEEINPYLVNHWPTLALAKGSTVFVPLCGKSKDMLWLMEQGHSVVGIELSEIAVREFFEENGLRPSVSKEGVFQCFAADHIKLYCGDFFALTPRLLGNAVAVYDRAALIAMPVEMRGDYVIQLNKLMPAASQTLLITLEYADGTIAGPPFCVSETEVRELFYRTHNIQMVERQNIDFKETDCIERVWRLKAI